MKRFFVVTALVFGCFLFSSCFIMNLVGAAATIGSAASQASKMSYSPEKLDNNTFATPKGNQVMLIGKLTLNTNIDIERLKRRYNYENLSEKYTNIYASAIRVDKNGYGSSDDGLNFHSNGSFFAITYDFPKSKMIEYKDWDFYLVYPRNSITFPLGFQVECNKDVKYAYIGSFYMDIDPNTFEVRSVKKADEYEDAIAWLNEKLPDKKGKREVVRAELLPLEND